MLGFAEGDRRAAPVLLQNPLREELSALKTQLAVGPLEALRHNLSHGLRDVRLFEVGEVFLPVAGAAGAPPEERPRVAGVLCGTRDHWLKEQPGDELDFYDVRAIVDELLDGLGLGQVEIRQAAPGEVPWLHPGVAAVVVQDGRIIGELGEIHPDLLQALEIETRAFAFELDLPQTEPPLPRYTPLPRFPAVDRDLSFFVDAGVPAARLLAALRAAGEPLLVGVRVLEDYREPGRVPEGKKGMLLGLTYRAPDRTLTDEEVQRAHDRVVASLRQHHAIDLR
jgi:phenylalanyl-tRNA synthetase beta chain